MGGRGLTFTGKKGERNLSGCTSFPLYQKMKAGGSGLYDMMQVRLIRLPCVKKKKKGQFPEKMI